MTCDQTQKVSLLIDGELSATEQSAVESHLLECAECYQTREEFLNLRSEIVAYQPALAPSAADAALARILSKQDSPVARARTAATATRRNPFSVLFGFEGFSPRLASVVALLAIAFAIGGIVLLRSRQPSDVANTVSTPPTPRQEAGTTTAGNEPSKENAPGSDAVAQRRSSGSKTGQPTRNKQLNNRGLKPERDRTAPSQPPRPQVGVPPTYAAVDENLVAPSGVRGHAVGSEMLMARHLEQSELLLRSFRNMRAVDGGSAPGIGYERRRARQLLYQNIRLRREADDAGDVEVGPLLSALEPILLDIANLRDKPRTGEVQAIRERVERKNLVPLLQVNSTTVARAYD
jgi:anti-sigma factor RsiW